MDLPVVRTHRRTNANRAAHNDHAVLGVVVGGPTEARGDGIMLDVDVAFGKICFAHAHSV